MDFWWNPSLTCIKQQNIVCHTAVYGWICQILFGDNQIDQLKQKLHVKVEKLDWLMKLAYLCISYIKCLRKFDLRKTWINNKFG
jgi:hypothetical protein